MGNTIDACLNIDISDKDIYQAMKEISGYLDITPGDFKELYIKAYRHAVQRLLTAVKACEIMTKEVVCITADTPIRDIASKMAEAKVAGVPIVDEERIVIGIISEKDFFREMSDGQASSYMDVIASCLNGRSCLAVPARKLVAREIMSAPPITIKESMPAVEIADLMMEKSINRVPVVDDKGKLVGIICRSDLVGSQLRSEQ